MAPTLDPAGRDPRTYAIIGAGMQVHANMGPGYLESVYHNCLALRLEERRVPFRREVPLDVEYLGKKVGVFRADFVCFEGVIVELKAQASLGRADVAQLANYLSATRQPVGVLLNFGAPSLEYRRVVGRHALPHWPEEDAGAPARD